MAAMAASYSMRNRYTEALYVEAYAYVHDDYTNQTSYPLQWSATLAPDQEEPFGCAYALCYFLAGPPEGRTYRGLLRRIDIKDVDCLSGYKWINQNWNFDITNEYRPGLGAITTAQKWKDNYFNKQCPPPPTFGK